MGETVDFGPPVLVLAVLGNSFSDNPSFDLISVLSIGAPVTAAVEE